MAMSGSPISTIPRRKAGLSRRAPVEREGPDGADERADPDRRVEVADAAVAEVEQLRCAVTTMKTWTAPKMAVWAVSSTIITRRERFTPSVVKPARRSAVIVEASSSRRGASA